MATGRRLQCRGTATGVDLRAERTGDGPRDNSAWYDAVRRCGSHSKDGRREGDQRLAARGSGARPCTTQRQRGDRRAVQPGRQNARRAGSALERGWSVFQPVNPTLTACFSKNLNCATKIVDTKVVDETSLYNICKGRPMVFSRVWAGAPSKVRVL
jgi:hypothetical protein